MVSFPHAIAVKNNYDWGAFWTILFHSPMQSRSRTTLWYWLGRFALFHSPCNRGQEERRASRLALPPVSFPHAIAVKNNEAQMIVRIQWFHSPCNRGQEQLELCRSFHSSVSFPHAIAVKNNRIIGTARTDSDYWVSHIKNSQMKLSSAQMFATVLGLS